MRCQRRGCSPTSTIGLGFTVVSSARRVPNPPAKITDFKRNLLFLLYVSDNSDGWIVAWLKPGSTRRDETSGTCQLRGGLTRDSAYRSRCDGPNSLALVGYSSRLVGGQGQLCLDLESEHAK